MAKKNLNQGKRDFPISAFKVKEVKLRNFYKKIFPERSCKLEVLWKWLYRVKFFNNKNNPIIIVKKNEIVGHMGIIPFWLNLRGKKISACWYADMFVLPKCRGEGIAKKITNELMKRTQVGFGFGNEKSMGVFKKFGWEISNEGFIHHFFLKPMDHMRFSFFKKNLELLSNLINFIFINLISINYNVKKSRNKYIKVESLNKKNIDLFLNIKKNKNIINTIIDKKYLYWRFLDSPDLNKYKILKNNSIAALVKERKDKPKTWHLDILLINNLTNSKILIPFLADVILWSKRHNFSYVRVYISDKSLSKKISYNLLSIYRNPRFFFYAKNKKFMNILKNSKYFWNLSDSDWEIIS